LEVFFPLAGKTAANNEHQKDKDDVIDRSVRNVRRVTSPALFDRPGTPGRRCGRWTQRG